MEPPTATAKDASVGSLQAATAAPDLPKDTELRDLITKNLKTFSPATAKFKDYPKPPNSDIPNYIDHTLLKPNKNVEDYRDLCSEAQRHSFVAICVHLEWVKLCAKFLDNRLGKWRPVSIACVVDFPDGVGSLEVKGHQVYWAVKDGARELDVVIDYPAIKEGRFEEALAGIKIVREKADECLKEVGGEGKVLVKVIVETCMLQRDEIITACTIAKAGGADFVKTSTGFKGKGANVEDVRLMKAVVGDEVDVKASGGIKGLQDCLSMIEAGATRIGTSAGLKISSEIRELTHGPPDVKSAGKEDVEKQPIAGLRDVRPKDTQGTAKTNG